MNELGRLTATMQALALTLAVALLVPSPGQAQSLATGQLLVATPELGEPSFAETVLLLIHHGDDGSLGLFVNRPTWVNAAEAFPEEPALASYGGTLYVGGPVAPTQLLLLVRSSPGAAIDGTPVLADLEATADLELLARGGLAPTDESNVRLYAGHAAWAPGQLEEEIERGSWRAVSGRSDYVFWSEPLDLWRVLRDAPSSELVVGLRP